MTRMQLLPSTFALAVSAISLNVFSEPERMEHMVITATRTEQPVNEALASVTVLSASEIEKLQTRDMFSLLQKVPGLTVSRTGGQGSNLSIFMRGTNTNQTLVLIDGHRMSSATSGSAALQYIDPEQIERIEVVRGARASLYGADAIGGVIHIFTKRGSDQNSAYVRAGWGTYNTQRYGGGIKGGADGTYFGLDVNFESTKGIDNTETDAFASGDRDGYHNTAVNLSFDQDLTEAGTLSVNYLKNQGSNDYDFPAGCFDYETSQSVACRPYTNFEFESYNAVLDFTFFEMWDFSFLYGGIEDSQENRDRLRNDPTEVSSVNDDFITRRDSLTWQNDLTFDQVHTLSLGADYYNDSVNGRIYVFDSATGKLAPSPYLDADGNPVKDRYNIGLFSQYQAVLEGYDLVVGVRQDDNQAYGQNVTGNIAWGIELPADLKLILSYATAFRAPTFNDLYYPGFGVPTLQPEKSRMAEISLRGDYDIMQWQLNVYQNRLENLIIFDDSIQMPANVGRAWLTGGEIIYGLNIEDYQLNVNYSYVDPKDKNNDTVLINRPEHSLNIDFIRSFLDAAEVGVSYLAQSKRYTTTDNRYSVGGYGIVDLFGSVSLTDELQLQLKISNLFNRDYVISQYQTFPGVGNYETYGITGFFSVIYRPTF